MNVVRAALRGFLVTVALVALLPASSASAGAESTPIVVVSERESVRFSMQWGADAARFSEPLSVTVNQFATNADVIGHLADGSADIGLIDLAPSTAQRRTLVASGRGDDRLIPLASQDLAIAAPSNEPTRSVDSATLCGWLTSTSSGFVSGGFIVHSDASGANLALSDFCIRREPAIWEAYRRYVAANANYAASASPEFLAGEPTATFPPTPGRFGASGSDGVANVINQGLGRGVVRLEAARQRGLTVFTLADDGGGHIAGDGTSATALDAAVQQADGALSTQQLPIHSAYPLVDIDYGLAPRLPSENPRRTSMLAFLRFGLGAGQGELRNLGYNPLPPGILRLGQTRLDELAEVPPFALPEFPAPVAGMVAGLFVAVCVVQVQRRRRMSTRAG